MDGKVVKNRFYWGTFAIEEEGHGTERFKGLNSEHIDKLEFIAKTQGRSQWMESY